MKNNDNHDTEPWRQLPIFKKALVILKIAEDITDANSTPLTESNASSAYNLSMKKHHLQSIKENSLLIPVKIAGAIGNDLYDHKMENAVLIRKAARELITDIEGLQIAGFKETESLDRLESEIEEFRPIFAEWVKTFDPSCHSIDRWGLFNPPGVDYNDTENYDS